jgi:hypothetical protein
MPTKARNVRLNIFLSLIPIGFPDRKFFFYLIFSREVVAAGITDVMQCSFTLIKIAKKGMHYERQSADLINNPFILQAGPPHGTTF